MTRPGCSLLLLVEGWGVRGDGGRFASPVSLGEQLHKVNTRQRVCSTVVTERDGYRGHSRCGTFHNPQIFRRVMSGGNDIQKKCPHAKFECDFSAVCNSPPTSSRRSAHRGRTCNAKFLGLKKKKKSQTETSVFANFYYLLPKRTFIRMSLVWLACRGHRWFAQQTHLWIRSSEITSSWTGLVS